jgi:predicted oxidoreductase (fatty acid repression mutant protein)
MSKARAYLDALTNRRSQYAIGKDVSLSQQELTDLIKEAVRQSPSSFNSQSSRVVILHGAQSDKFWGFVKDAIRKILPPETYAEREPRLNGFAAGAGTVLFYEDQDVVADLQKKFALYADNFPFWSEHSTGMAQLSVWTTLSEAGVGATLQHYNPLADAAAAKEWNIPASWKLRAQMPFGSIKGEPKEKGYMDDAQRFRVF